MIVDSVDGCGLQITLASNPGEDPGGEVQAILRAIRVRREECEVARSVRVARTCPSHSQMLDDLPILIKLEAALKEQGIEEISLEW